MDKIDFVITWVDPSDKKWQKDYTKYSDNKDIDFVRFRDWDNIQYFFRGVEQFAPWVNKIYFVTYGHIPKWLNVKNDKLVIVKHEDFIPKEYLPTFSSRAIELNLWRIKELSNKFVLFNDDIFLTNYVKPTDFFIKDKVVDSYAEKILLNENPNDKFYHSMFNIMGIINKEYNKGKFQKDNFRKVFNFKNGKKLINTILLTRWNKFTGFEDPHLCQPFFKENFEKAYYKNNDFFINTYKNKFRGLEDVTQYLIRYKQLLNGDFVNRDLNFGKGFPLDDNNTEALKAIETNKYKSICLNDSSNVSNFIKVQKDIIKSFNKILPNKSSFEK